MPTLGAAVIGLGVGEQHAQAFARLRNCTVRWVYDVDGSRMDRVVKDLGQGAPAESFEAILADPSVDIVSIASYDDAHCEQAIRALQAGKHVFVEKPMCRSLEELREINKAWHENGRRQLVSNLVLRAAPVYQWLKHRIEAGDLGELYAFDGDYLYGRLHKITEGWRGKVDAYSVLLGGGIHLLDLMLWLTGQRPASVTATGNRICTGQTNFHYYDYVSATFQFPSGLIGRITANFGCVHRHQHVLRLFGTKGTFICDDMGPRLHNTREPSSSAEALDLPVLPPSKGALIPGFVGEVLDGDGSGRQTRHEFDLMGACMAADEALAARTPISIDYL